MKTIKEALKEYITRVYFNVWQSASVEEQKLQTDIDFKSDAKFVEQWFPVKDELPQNQDIVLVKTNLSCVAIGYLHGKKSGFITYGDDAYNQFGHVEFWRPIEPK
mgnify:CR=1 FL=1